MKYAGDFEAFHSENATQRRCRFGCLGVTFIRVSDILSSVGVNCFKQLLCRSPATGADLANICKEAALMALREDPNASHVENRHFQEAWEHQMSSSTKD